MKNSRSDNDNETIIPPVLPTYARADVAFDRGEGMYVFDAEGRKYLDFGAGVAVNSLGHCHPYLVEALNKQASKIWHTSNLYNIEGQEKLARRLCEETFADSVFFTNSGAEAIECAMKMARRYHQVTGNEKRYRIITFEGSFHGRTLATIAAAGQNKLIDGFGPMMEGFDHVPFHRDMSKVEAAITDETAAIMIEPLQGEGGIRPVSPENLQILRDIADKHGILIILDEIQCGMGRTGRLYAHQASTMTPDIMASAKGIGSGFPFGACLATEEVARTMTPGTHGSTYGGNPLAMAVGNAVFDVMLKPNFLPHVVKMADLLRVELMKLRKNYPEVIDMVRGIGLMMGLKLHMAPAEFISTALEEGLILVAASNNTVRLLPPLIVEPEHISEALEKLSLVCQKLSHNNEMEEE